MANEWTVPGDFATINAALASSLVSDYDTIRVGPGLYNNASEGGPIVITKMIQLLGAQAGVDARTRLGTPGTESVIEIVNGSGSIQINRSHVVVDGFTVQNNTNGVGILTSPSFSGYWIFNNIIQNNAGGLYFNSDTTDANTTFSQAKFNLFRTNNQTGGGAGGNGIYTDFGTKNLYIDSNTFTGHTPAASINFAAGSNGGTAFPQQNIVISNNRMITDNSIALTLTTNVKITGNFMNNTQGSAIFIAGGTNFTEIENNSITNSTGNGISVNTIFTTPAVPNTNIRAKDNSIQGNATAGLNVAAGAYAVSPRRLDATNNWWGSATGPTNAANPGGMGDAVIDPDGVTEFIPFLTSNPVPTPPGAVSIEAVARLLSSPGTSVAATRAAAVNAAIAGTGGSMNVGNVPAVWPSIEDYMAPDNAELIGNPDFIWQNTTMAAGEHWFFSQALQITDTGSHVVEASVFTDNAHILYIEEYDESGAFVQSITPIAGLNDGSMMANAGTTTDTSPPYNWQRIRTYNKTFTPGVVGNFIVVTVEALNYIGNGPVNPAGVSFIADFYRTSV